MDKTSIQYIKEVAKIAIGGKLEHLETEQAKAAIEGVMQTVGLSTREEVLLFCAYFDKTCQGRSMDFEDVSHYFGCSALDIMEMLPSVKSLLSKGYLKRSRGGTGDCLAVVANMSILVDDSVFSAIIGNSPVVPNPASDWEKTELDRYEFCAAIGKMVEDDDTDTATIESQTLRLEENNLHHDFICTLRNNINKVTDRVLFYAIAYDHYRHEGRKKSAIGPTLRDIYSNFSHYLLVKKEILGRTHILIAEGLIEKFDDKEMRLTKKGCALFFGEDLQYFVKDHKSEDIYDFLHMIKEFFSDENQYKATKDSEDLPTILEEMENENSHISQLSVIKTMLYDATDRAMFYFIGANLVDNGSSTLSNVVKIFRPAGRLHESFDMLKSGKTLMQHRGYVEMEKKDVMGGPKTLLKLSDKGTELLLGEDAHMFVEEIDDKDLITPDKVSEKRLFFSEDLDRQLSLIRSSLQEETFANLRSRLEEQHLPKGVAILLYGEPGTGKTESVMQIARATGRTVMHVDISNTKSMWFGESEKIIKKVFADYRRLCERSKVKPILLFNEADAIFSKRRDVSLSNVAQTENAIQNIILEEMEHLDGILIATTNLADNLDGAFERRFLFKVRYDKPTVEAKKNIWQNKLGMLTSEETQALAVKYDFSGGEIDNIVRKCLMQEIVSGSPVKIDNLHILCSEERLANACGSKIGFC